MERCLISVDDLKQNKSNKKMDKETAEHEQAEEEATEGDTEKPEEKPEETPEAVKEEEEKKAKPTKPDQKKKRELGSKEPIPTKSKLKRIIEIIKTGKFIIKDHKFKKLKKHPSLGIWDPFLEEQYTKSEIKLFEIKKRKLFKKPKGAQQKQYKTSKPLVKTFKRLVEERKGTKKQKKTKLTKLQKQKLKLKNKLLVKPKRAGCSKFLEARRICRLLKKLKFIRLSTERKVKPKVKRKPKIIKIKKMKKSKMPKKSGGVDPKKGAEQKSPLKSKGEKKKSKKKAEDKSKEKGKERTKTKKRHKLKDAKRAKRKHKKKRDKKKRENEDDKKLNKKKDLKEDKEKSKAPKQKTVKIPKEVKETQPKPIPKPKEEKKPKPLKTKLMEKSKTIKPETKKVPKKSKKVKIKRTVLCKFKKRYEYREIIYIDFKSPEITTDEDSMKTRTTSTIPRTMSEQYLKFRKKNENLEKIKQKLIDELIHSLKSEKLQFVEMLKYEPVLKLFLNKKHLLSKFEIIEILNRNLNILNYKIDRVKKYSKNFIKNAPKYKEYHDNLLFREIKRIYSDYIDVLEILKFKFDIEPEEILKTPLENLIKLQNYQPEFLFKRVRFKYLKNIKKALKERNKELKLLNRKPDYVVSDAILEEIFNSYVPLNLVFDDIPTFIVNDLDYQLEYIRLKNLLYFNYCNSMDQEWDVTLDILNLESDVVAMTKYHKRDIILEKYKRLQLDKPKRPPMYPVDLMQKRIKIRKSMRRIDTNYDWNKRTFNLEANSFVMPVIDCKYFTIYERPNRSLFKDALNEKIILVREEFRKHDVFLDPIKQLTEFKHIFEKMDIDWANYPKEKQQKRQLKFSVGDFLFRTIYPEGFPRRKLDYFVFLNRQLEDDVNKNAYKNVFDLNYQETDESSSEPRIIKKTVDGKEVQVAAPVVYEEEEIGEGEEMEEEPSVDLADPIKMYDKPVKTYSESDFEGSESTDRSSFVFDYIENEYNRMMNAFRKLKFDNSVQSEFPPKVQNSTQIHIEFDNVNKNVCEQVCQYNIKTFYSECIKKKLLEEEEARRKKYLYYIVLETPIIWEIPKPPQSLLNARIKFSKAKFLRRVCNYNRDIPVLLEYFKDIFSTKTMPGVIRTFNYLWNFGVKGSYGYKVVLLKWYPSRNDLLFVLFSKKKQINYGRSIQDKIGHMFVIELQYWHKPARFIKFPAAPVILEFNPQRLNYMAIVLKTCEIQIYNLALSNYNKYKPVLTCANVLYRLKIVNLHWISDKKINESNYMFFFTFSRCGYVDKWQIHRTYLSVVPHIRIDETMGPTFDFTTVQMGVEISSVAFHPSYRTIFLLGTCTGLLYRCTTEHVNNTFTRIVAYDDNLKSIQFNRLVPKIFLTYGDFRLIKIWDYKMLSCIYEINTEDYITCIEWAPFSSTVFVVAQTKALFVYDLNLNENNEIAKQNIYDKDSNVTTITAFTFHHAYDYAITVGCNNGELCLVKLAPQIRGHILRFELGETQPNTMENQLKKVQFMLDSHRDYHDSESDSDTTDSEQFGVLVPTEGEEKEGDEGEGGGDQQAAAVESDED